MFAGASVTASSPQGRFADGAARLSGRVVRDTEAYGKHLLHHYEGELSLHVHLGLYGKVTDGELPAPPPVGQVRLRLTGATHWMDLRGPAACELFTPGEVAALRERLGADPLRDDADPAAAYRRISTSRLPLGALLLDQSVVAGTGLVYVTEVLFRAGIAPTSPGHELTEEQWRAMWTDLCNLMKREWLPAGSTPSTVSTPQRRWGARRGWTGTAVRCTCTVGPANPAWSAAT